MTKRLTTAALMAGLCIGGGFADAAVPTVADMTACNEEAREAVRGRTAFPTTTDEARAENSRQAAPNTIERTDATGTITESADPQIQGMDAVGARDAAYRAGYRVCMRKKGF